MLTIRVKNIGKGVAFVHTYSDGIKVLKSGESSEFKADDLAYLQEVLNSPHFSVNEEIAQEQSIEQGSKPEDEEQQGSKPEDEEQQGSKPEDEEQQGSKPYSDEDLEAMAKIKENLLAEAESNNLTWVEESLNQEVIRIFEENKAVEQRKIIIEELRKAIRGNNKKRIGELMAQVELTPEEKTILFPPKPANSSNNRKKNNRNK